MPKLEAMQNELAALKTELDERHKNGTLTRLSLLLLTIRLLLMVAILALWILVDCMLSPIHMIFSFVLNLLMPKGHKQKSDEVDN